ncbi:ankyrin [Fonsecaea pedrosoi]|nr:ankyrin [Fonsecaea pedrosoi]
MSAGKGPFTRASAAGDLGEVGRLINDLAFPLDDLATIDLWTAFDTAVQNDEVLIVDSLLTLVKPTQHNLVTAVENSSRYMIEILLQHGCDLNQQLRSDFLHYLIRNSFSGSSSMGQTLTPPATSITALSVAAASASKEVIELLFKLGASADRGQPLHYAVINGRSDDIVTLFLNKGTPINARMFESHPRSFAQRECLGLATPIHEAVKAKNVRLVQLLLKYGANMNIPDTLGQLPQLENLGHEINNSANERILSPL